jgi:hypothetical protein
MEDIGKKINVQNKVKKARAGAKPKYCLLCGEEIKQICNSHSVPQMVLNTIAENGMLYNKNKVARIDYYKCEDGVKSTGTFHYICRECDGKEFSEYENPNTILTKPTDLMMAEIAIKNLLLMISARKYERELYQNDIQYLSFVNIQQMLKVNELDIRDYMDDLELYKKIKCGEDGYGFQIVYWEVLPYVCPIAVQGTFTIYKDMNGTLINDPNDLDEKKKNQSAHLCVFPFDGSTAILLFYHKRDKSYKQLWHQINSSSRDVVLKYINYLIFALADNFFFSKSISETILNDDAFIRLSREYIEQPNYGLPKICKEDEKYLSNKPVSADEIPMIFDKRYSITL